MENLLRYNVKEKTTNIHSTGITAWIIITIVVILYKIIKYVRNIDKKTKDKTNDQLNVPTIPCR